MAWIWKSFFLVLVGIVLLRVAGRKSISQMTVATTVIMISIGTTIVQPIANHQLWKAIGSAAIFVVTLLIVEYLQLRFNWLERLISGHSRVVIQNGEIVQENLKAVRLTVDQLEVRLRQKGISTMKDVKTATLEPNGQLGYELMRHAQPVTIGDLERLLGSIPSISGENANASSSLFREVSKDSHEKSIPKKLH